MAIGYQVSTVKAAGNLRFAKLAGEERLGEPFRYEVHMLSDRPSIDLAQVLGQKLTLAMSLAESGTRHLNGVITRLSHVGRVGPYEHYLAIIRPNFWLLKQSADCRIFQNKSIPEVVKSVLSDFGIAVNDKLTESYPTIEYCVQYRESNFDFINRLLEKEGIYYFFTHSDGGHEMVLVDAASAHRNIFSTSKLPFQRTGVATRDVVHVWEFTPAQRVTSGTVSLTDYDFEKPRANLDVRSRRDADYDLDQGEVYDYPGKYLETDAGQPYARTQLESLQALEQLCSGKTNAAGIAAGGLFQLTEYPAEQENIEYLIVRAELRIEVVDLQTGQALAAAEAERGRGYTAAFDCVPASEAAFRSPHKTPRPVVGGPHTAVVVGKRGEEIWTDQYGRIKVQFHWDRLGKHDENSTCWLRVAQGWAGGNWGSIFIPRIGQEVVVQFLEGDPDRPLVTGSLYNADQMPPYKLPENMTQSGIKSRSTKDGGEDNFNELRFEDKKDAEEVYFHAERDFTRVVENNDSLKVGFDKKDQGNQTVDIYNDRTVTLDQGNDKLQVKVGDRTVLVDQGDLALVVDKGKRTEQIEGNDELTIRSGNHQTTVNKGDDKLTVSKGNHSITVSAGKSTIQAAQEIVLKVGGSSIKITPQEIALSAPKIKISGDLAVDISSNMGVSVDGGMKVDAKGVMATLQGSANTAVKGGIVMIN